MTLTTLLHLRNNTAELPGYGPIPGDEKAIPQVKDARK